MTSEAKDRLLEVIMNDIDITFEDEKTKAKTKRDMESGMAYLEDKDGDEIDFEKDMIALELLISYCRYGRSNAIEQFEHDFASNLTAFALRAAVKTVNVQEGAEDESEV